MKLRLAVLDDDETQLFLIKKQVESFNRKSENKVELDCFMTSDEFIKEFNHDLALIDVNLKGDEKDGFDVAKIIMKKYHKPCVMTSNFIKAEECLDALLPKVGLKISELVSRFNVLKSNLTKNSMQICFRSAKDYHGPRKSLVG